MSFTQVPVLSYGSFFPNRCRSSLLGPSVLIPVTHLMLMPRQLIHTCHTFCQVFEKFSPAFDKVAIYLFSLFCFFFLPWEPCWAYAKWWVDVLAESQHMSKLKIIQDTSMSEGMLRWWPGHKAEGLTHPLGAQQQQKQLFLPGKKIYWEGNVLC